MFILEQDALLLYCLRAALLGVLYALCYLLLGFQRLLTERFPRPLAFAVQFAVDLFSWCGVAFADILMVYSANRGRVRILALFFQAAAFLVGYLPLKKMVLKWERALLSCINRRIMRPIVQTVKRRVKEARIRQYNKTIEEKMKKDVGMSVDEIARLLEKE